MLVTELGMVTLVSELIWNAPMPMLATEYPPRMAGMIKVVGQVPSHPVTVAESALTV